MGDDYDFDLDERCDNQPLRKDIVWDGEAYSYYDEQE